MAAGVSTVTGGAGGSTGSTAAAVDPDTVSDVAADGLTGGGVVVATGSVARAAGVALGRSGTVVALVDVEGRGAAEDAGAVAGGGWVRSLDAAGTVAGRTTVEAGGDVTVGDGVVTIDGAPDAAGGRVNAGGVAGDVTAGGCGADPPEVDDGLPPPLEAAGAAGGLAVVAGRVGAGVVGAAAVGDGAVVAVRPGTVTVEGGRVPAAGAVAGGGVAAETVVGRAVADGGAPLSMRVRSLADGCCAGAVV